MTPYTRTREAFTDWITGLNGRTLAAAAGLVIGLAAAGLALSLVIVGPLYTCLLYTSRCV